jgi:hypothetical protein
MKKKVFGLITAIIASIFLSCGGGSSEEAKELLKLILQLVGIPQHIVVNICQDGNKNGMCDSSEIQARIDIEKGDTISTIFQKIRESENGKYLLETYDKTKDILLILEDSDNIRHDGGRITLNYSGLKKSQNEKELSILESMIDAGHLRPQDIIKVKDMNEIDRFYGILLEDLEVNYNTLRERELTPSRAMARNIEEMARELIENNVSREFPEQINECTNESCLNRVLGDMSEELLIDNEEAENIVQSENDIYGDGSNRNPYRDNGGNSDPYNSEANNDPYRENSNSDPYSEGGTNNEEPYIENNNHDPYNSENPMNPYNGENRNPYN